MTSTPSTGHPSARWSATAAVLAATVLAAAAAATTPAVAATGTPATAAAGYVRTTAISAPMLARPARYHYQTITVPGYPSVYVDGISDSGAYAGEACKDRNCTRVALFVASPKGKITFYRLPSNYSPTGDFNATATGMDNAGDVVGAYTSAHGVPHGFERKVGGTLTQINDPTAADGTVADGISPNGKVITGFYVDKAGVMHGFLLRGGVFTTYDVPGAEGTVVGFDTGAEFGGTYYTASGASLGFYVTGGKLHTLRAPAQPGARNPVLILSAVDAAGTLFGYVDSANLPGYGVAYAHGSYTTFRDPHEAGTGPEAGTVIYSANADGVVAGAYTYTGGNAQQFPYAKGFIARPDHS